MKILAGVLAFNSTLFAVDAWMSRSTDQEYASLIKLSAANGLAFAVVARNIARRGAHERPPS